MKTSPPSRPANWFVAFIILLTLGGLLRLLDLTDPPLDFQPSRQLRNSLVARDIYYSLLPTATTEQKELASSFARSVGQYEPPVIESIVAVTFLATGGENFIAARIWESLFWLAAGVALFDLMRRAVSPWAAVVAIAFYFVLPFSVQASRSFQPDPLMTAAFIAGIYFLYRWSEEQAWKWAILAGVFFGFATFVKIVIAFFVGAAAIAMVLFTLKKDFWKSKQVWAMAAIMVVPAFLFYILLNQGRSTEYFFAWTVTLIKLITSADFYSKWLAFVGSIFGLTMIFLSLAGALIATPRLRWLLISLWVGYVLYGLTLPFQMYTHSYYHIQLIPIIALGLASALNPLLESVAGQSSVGRVGFIALVIAVIGYQSWVARSVLIAEDFRHEPAFWKQVGDAIPANTDVIALTQDYGYRLMLFGWRKVSLWPLSTGLSEARGGEQDAAGDFADLTEGKEYFLVTASGQLEKQPDLKKILAQYPIAAEGDGYVLFDLRK
ncbi:glycosyltransferase family 39 protein [Candidatus Villigracilis affinis]|uniref:ArnT family glycosyltransferase n=1 Tax=Candidatus Villigracilis affinis TaxID=3140682 RepID=UPI001D1BFBF2|nr:glycosyltransferase family 39 protein [Anaerolineales bacterium]